MHVGWEDVHVEGGGIGMCANVSYSSQISATVIHHT